jgi:predicted Fe-Mo cluster-binding NifX family protein
MRIAVTSQNFRTVTGHAGKSRRFLVYEADGAGGPREVERLDLPKDMSLHDYHGDDHPLFALGLDAIVTQGAGQGFVNRMARQGIRVHATSEGDPLAACSCLAAGLPLPDPLPHEHEDPGHGHGAPEARVAGPGPAKGPRVEPDRD